MKAELLSDDDAVRASAFEAAILSALEIDPLEIDVDRWAAAYVWLSEQLNAGPDAPSATVRPPRGRLTEVDVAAVFGLIYAARTFHAAHRILSAYPPGSGPIIELGAGWGPFALRAVEHRLTPAVLVDASSAALDRARRLFACADAPEPTTTAADVSRLPPTDPAGGIAAAFVVNELARCDDPTALRAQVERWTERLSSSGRLYLVEPGTPRAARRLQQLRDHLPPGLFVHAPCTGAETCPLLDRPTDWCHFTWPSADGPLARTIADRARRRWQEQHVSFLVLGRRSFDTGGMSRVLDTRPHGHAKVVSRTCTQDGIVPVTALRRHPAYAVVSGFESGSLVSVDAGVVKGDGVRVESAQSVRIIGRV